MLDQRFNLGGAFKKLLLLALLLAQAGLASAALDIVVVGDKPGIDDPMVNFLKELYPTATVEYTMAQYQTLDQTKIDRLNRASLVVATRAATSGQYATDAAEATQWNSLTCKLVLMSPYVARSTHWKWFDSTAVASTADAGFNTLSVTDAADPIFNGVTITGGKVQIYSTGFNNRALTVTTAHNGKDLAQIDPGPSKVSLVRWTNTSQPFYPGGPETPKGPRIFFHIQDDDQNMPTPGNYTNQLADLTPAGKKLLQNVFTSLLPVPAAISVNPAATVTFDPIQVVWNPGSKSTKDVVITNTGSSPLNFVAQGSEANQGLVLTGSPRVTIKSVSASTATPLAPGASITVTLEFAPLASDYTAGGANTLNATLGIFTNADNTPNVQITTTGTTVPVELSGFEAN